MLNFQGVYKLSMKEIVENLCNTWGSHPKTKKITREANKNTRNVNVKETLGLKRQL